MKEKLQVKFHLLFIIYQCRGPEGFWKAYPPLKEKGIVLERMSTPHWFETDPKFAWGFFGHRYNLYQKTTPHNGFNILRKWGESKERGYFVFTSNVDGQFQKAGFSEDRILECHGSINFMQCCQPMEHTEIWPVPEDTAYDVDVEDLVSPFNKGTIIRINPRDWRVPDGNISLPIGGLEALEMIEDELQKG